MKCEICGGEFKNLGVHKRFCGTSAVEPQNLIVDENITEKPLSILISEIKNLMKVFRSEMDVRISDRGGKTSEVEIRVRIQL